MNRHQIILDEITTGMLMPVPAAYGIAPPEHNKDRINEPARFFAWILSGDLDRLIGYAERGKKIIALAEAADAASTLEEIPA
jgi:hypothetical protein